jgi:hypothetical protein
MRTFKKFISVILFSLGVFLMLEYIDDEEFLSFSEINTLRNLAAAISAGIINELIVKYRKKSS